MYSLETEKEEMKKAKAANKNVVKKDVIIKTM